MKFIQYGKEDLPVMILLHGGGLSVWSLQKVADQLAEQYCVITPIIDGHGDDNEHTFVSIEACADDLIQYIDTTFHGKVFVIGGLSIGAQIVVEALTKRQDIAEYALIESALVYPIKGITTLTITIYQLCYGLIKKRWFAKLQAKSLFVPEDMFETYYCDSAKMSKETLINITLSNGTYQLKEEIQNTKSQTLIIVGEKEIGIMRMSAKRLHGLIKGSELYIAKGMKHGELSLRNSSQYIELISDFIKRHP